MKKLVNKIRRKRWEILGRNAIRKLVLEKKRNGEDLKIVLGGGHESQGMEDWIITDLPQFDILDKEHWKTIFGSQKANKLLAEHVLEHLDESSVEKVLGFAHFYLAANGVFRIAVPDAFHPAADYLKRVLPPADGHLSAWNIENLEALLIRKGFSVTALEFYDKSGIYHSRPFTFENGIIYRSKTQGFISEKVANYSSLIIDCRKSQ